MNYQEISDRIKIIKKDKFNYFDKLYFLFGLKPVLRIQRKNGITIKEALRGLSGFDYLVYKNFVFVSKNKKKLELAKKLTSTNCEKLSEQKNRQLNYRLGVLYGYPKCCAKKFPELNTRDSKKEIEMALENYFIYKNKKFFIHHYRCKKNCLETKRLKQKILNKIKQIDNVTGIFSK